MIFAEEEKKEKEQKGQLVEENGKAYIIDDKGNKLEVISGKEYVQLMLKWAKNSSTEKRYSDANKKFESAMIAIFQIKLQDEDLLYKIISEAKTNEEKSKSELSFINKDYYNFYSNIYFYFGSKFSYQKKHLQSIFYYQKSVHYNPSNINAYNNMGIAYDISGKYKLAVEAYNNGLKINPKDKHINFNLACSYSMQNKVNKALDYLEKAIKLGYNDKKLIMNDESLKNIKETERFKKIISKLK